MKAGDRCTTKGTQFLPEGITVKLLDGPHEYWDGSKPPKWRVRVLSQGYPGLTAFWYVSEACLERSR